MMKLGQCTINPNHWYSLHSNDCPWCRIFHEQGHDYYPFLNNPVNLQDVHETVEFPNPLDLPQQQPKTYAMRFIAILVISIFIIAVIFALPSVQSKPVISDPPTSQPTFIPTPEPQPVNIPVPTLVPTLGKNAEITLPFREIIPLNYGTVTRSFQSDKVPVHITMKTDPEKITDKKVFFTGTDDPVQVWK